MLSCSCRHSPCHQTGSWKPPCCHLSPHVQGHGQTQHVLAACQHQPALQDTRCSSDNHLHRRHESALCRRHRHRGPVLTTRRHWLPSSMTSLQEWPPSCPQAPAHPRPCILVAAPAAAMDASCRVRLAVGPGRTHSCRPCQHQSESAPQLCWAQTSTAVLPPPAPQQAGMTLPQRM